MSLKNGIRESMRGALLDAIYADFLKSIQTDKKLKTLIRKVMEKELNIVLNELNQEEKTIGFKAH